MTPLPSHLRRELDALLERASDALATMQHAAISAAETGDPLLVGVARAHLRYARFDYERFRRRSRETLCSCASRAK